MEEKDVLYCLSSGVPASVEVENELLPCQVLGISTFTTFLKECLIDRTVSFYAPLNRLSLKTFASMKKSKKLTSSNKKVVEIKAERNIFSQLVLLSEDSNISIERALTYPYPLGPVPWALATADRIPMKTDKAKLLHHLEDEISHSERPNLSQASWISDGNALLRFLTNLPNTFEKLAEKVFMALPKQSGLILSLTHIRRTLLGMPKKVAGVTKKIPHQWSKDKNFQGLERLPV